MTDLSSLNSSSVDESAVQGTDSLGPREAELSGWRTIDSLPWEPAPGEQFVLLWNGHWRGVGRRFAGYDGDPGFCDETTEFITPDPTHWMPLPAPPSEQPEGQAQ